MGALTLGSSSFGKTGTTILEGSKSLLLLGDVDKDLEEDAVKNEKMFMVVNW
ncbi:hypothetical protein [Nostoc sp. MS1]|uniref:hypothetical protein n=1 Tax=Nostoc sp. MS1 TaxID=2764711 RepID=UPI001CC49A70|nr:hypothetical protein [Nostoc sp. MS1]BCL36569.1 hypothetical protein NSMS1_30160 [Nostoc sp. MS1]